MKNTILFGDCRDSLRAMAAAGVQVQMCVTSPPYFGLRDYGHDGQIGLEETPEQFIAELVEVFRCVRDVLASDGTLWVNIGDSYAANRGSQPSPTNTRNKAGHVSGATVPVGLKPKDLIGIPWMLAFALRADGWYLRQDIIWHKPNCMPSSVSDRCTSSHEHLFLLSKSQSYQFDHLAIQEDAISDHQSGNGFKRPERLSYRNVDGSARGNDAQWTGVGGKRNRRDVWSIPVKPYKGAHFAVFPSTLIEPCILAGSQPGDIVLDPFMGSGTTAAVAIEHGRLFLGCELNADYKSLQDERIAAAQTLVAEAEAEAARVAAQMCLFGEAA